MKAAPWLRGPAKGLSVIGSRLINFCWYFFKLGAALAVVGMVAVGAYLFTRLDEEIRSHVERTLSEQYPHLNVTVGGARLVEGKAIAIYDLAISETSSSRLQNNLLVIDEIMLLGDVQMTQLLQKNLRFEQVILKHPQLWVSQEAAGRWNIQSLWPPPTCGQGPPAIDIQNAFVAISDQADRTLAPLTLRDINLSVVATACPAATAKGPGPTNLPGSLAGGSPAAHVFEARGSLTGPNLKRADIQARVDPDKKTVQLKGKWEDLQLTRELHAWADRVAGPALSQTRLQGRLDGSFDVKLDLQGEQPAQLTTQMQLTEGRLDDPRLPRPLTDVTCTLQCSNNVLQIEQLRGNCGPADVVVAVNRTGWGPAAPFSLVAKVVNLPLDDALYRTLPPLLQLSWDKHRPTGEGDADVQLAFDGDRWLPTILLTGRKLAFESDKLRYRLNEGSGTLRYALDEDAQPRLDIDLVGYGGGQPLRVVGQVFDPRPGAPGWVEISGRNVEIEQRLIAALPEKPRQVIRSLHPRGQFHVHWRLERTEPYQVKPHTSLRLELANCRIKYDKFPYPLSGITGLITADDGHWTFSDLVSGGSRAVRCQGNLQPTATGSQLSLQLTGQQIPLDDDLLRAVPEPVQRAWAELRPRGRIDLAAQVQHQPGLKKPSILVTVVPRPESALIEPRFFPYSLEKIEGKLTYQEGQLWLHEMRAQHGRVSVRTNGAGYFDTQGGWNIQLEGLSADHLKPQHDLMLALPRKLSKLIESLRPTGSFRLHNGLIGISKAPGQLAQTRAHWDVQLDCHQTDLHCGIDLQNVHGTVHLRGESQGPRCYSSGELAIETATFEDVQFSNIQGPLWVDESRCLLGRWATERGQTPRHLTAKVYDGQLVADAQVAFEGLPKYLVEASLTEANLSRISNERFASQNDYSGKVSAIVNLRGTGRSTHTLAGDGQVQIRDANILEVPLLVGMLKVLRNKTPDTTAFNHSDIEFRIEGRHIYLDKLDFLGDAVSFLGKGETNFDQQLNLVFYGIVGRNEIRFPLFQYVIKEAGKQFMQLYVDGTLANPQVHTQAFPAINQLLQQIQSELEAPKPAPGALKAERPPPAVTR